MKKFIIFMMATTIMTINAFAQSSGKHVVRPVKEQVKRPEKKQKNSPFASCKYLTRIVVDNENMNYDSRYNCNAIIEKRSSALISGCRKTEIPSDIIKIASHAFGNGDIGYKMNSFPSSLKIIGGFNYIESDSDTLKIPPTIEEIYGDAFWQTIKVVYVPFSCSLKTSGGLKSFYPDTKIIRY